MDVFVAIVLLTVGMFALMFSRDIIEALVPFEREGMWWMVLRTVLTVALIWGALELITQPAIYLEAISK